MNKHNNQTGSEDPKIYKNVKGKIWDDFGGAVYAPNFINNEGNESRLSIIESKNFPGIVPELLEKGYVPLTAKEVLEQRLVALQRDKKPIKELMQDQGNDSSETFRWGSQYISTFSGVVYDGKGNVKIIPKSEELSGLNENSPLVFHSALQVPNGTFDSFDSQAYSRNDINKINREFSENKLNEAYKNPILLDLVENDSDLIKTYTNEFLEYTQNNSDLFMSFNCRNYEEEYSPGCETILPIGMGRINNGSSVGSGLQISQMYTTFFKSPEGDRK
jgi:hypothetical protein